jgi:hypothetical protein
MNLFYIHSQYTEFFQKFSIEMEKQKVWNFQEVN